MRVINGSEMLGFAYGSPQPARVKKMDAIIEFILNFFFYHLGFFVFKFLKKVKILRMEKLNDWGYVTIGFVVFFVAICLLFFYFT
jgi:hypothetical protein